MSERVSVVATRWELGWELELDTGGVTQVRALTRAVQQVRDYLDTVDPGQSHDDWQIDIVPDIGPVADDVKRAKAASQAAAAATVDAAKSMRRVVKALRSDGLSVADIACVLGVSKGRVSQLAHDMAEAA
jgi:DNA-directed RNA polymerase specialized sigma24 family protein